MMILVGVTVSVVMQGGLFDKAKTAANKTQLEIEKEQLISVALSAIDTDGKVDYLKLETVLPNGFTGNNGRYTSETGRIYEIDLKGNVEIVEYLEGTNLRVNTKYYSSGKKDSNFYTTFSSDGYMYIYYEEDQNETQSISLKYILDDNMVKISLLEYFTAEELSDFDEETLEYLKNTYTEITIIKTENNDILISKDGAESQLTLAATNSNGLIYFSGEKYINGEKYITLNEDSLSKHLESGTNTWLTPPVLFNGVIYYGDEQVITSTDNFETLLFEGEIYTKATE